MAEKVNLENILFLDIETVPLEKNFADTDETTQLLWEKKSTQFRKEGQTAAEVYQRAGIYAEFGRVLVISCGFFYYSKDRGGVFRVKSFYGDDEKVVLKEFCETLSKLNNFILCAHNGKEFDFPFLARRILINRQKLPPQLNIAGKKPWEIPHLDTMEMWKFGDYKNFTSLAVLSYVFGLPSSKDDIDGSQVADIYYQTGDIKRITKYCEKDMIAVARIFQCMRGENPLKDDDLEFTE